MKLGFNLKESDRMKTNNLRAHGIQSSEIYFISHDVESDIDRTINFNKDLIQDSTKFKSTKNEYSCSKFLTFNWPVICK